MVEDKNQKEATVGENIKKLNFELIILSSLTTEIVPHPFTVHFTKLLTGDLRSSL